MSFGSGRRRPLLPLAEKGVSPVRRTQRVDPSKHTVSQTLPKTVENIQRTALTTARWLPQPSETILSLFLIVPPCCRSACCLPPFLTSRPKPHVTRVLPTRPRRRAPIIVQKERGSPKYVSTSALESSHVIDFKPGLKTKQHGKLISGGDDVWTDPGRG